MPLSQPGKKSKCPFHILLDSAPLFSQIGPHLEIFSDGQAAEYFSAFRDLGNAFTDDPVRGEVMDRAALDQNTALFSLDEA